MGKLKNVAWFCLEKIIILGGGLITSILVARYLGAEQFGVFSLAVTLTALPVAVSQWGGAI
ncbi:hypothetical protein [Pseudoalteromonas sp. SCSIO 43101]|uniref:hypothetical protein n=1 Tax=Pseudoalteromonas sp. SCSIO 43101 TaxID=2822847 RepID=UPI00202B041A|nr:hypothetical protein [Pseudoalteromonas sp. SCSIO 43101]URQ89944.1 oligosaccharide flippase family protein [Pseudoalteromonas sp. SCSIO 43101]